MLAMNKKMATQIQHLNRNGGALPEALFQLAKSGFFEREGCIFLASLATAHTNVSARDFPDKTGYECFINSIHMDDHVQEHYLYYACLFVEKLFLAWRIRSPNEVARAIISSDDSDAVVKFHTLREHESWVSEDLEKYEESILVADSSTLSLF
jgi:hypothetical protein